MALDWDDVLNVNEKELETPQYLVLPEGDYEFTVDDVTYGNYNGSDKIPACKMATLKAKIATEKGTAYAGYRFYLYEGRGTQNIARFFKAVGFDVSGGLKPGLFFKKAVQEGRSGIAHVKPNEYNGRTYNDIAYFKNPEEKKAETGKSSWDNF